MECGLRDHICAYNTIAQILLKILESIFNANFLE